MIDHVSFPVSDLAKSAQFYRAALAPLGIGVMFEASPEQTGGYLGMGAEGRPFFWIGQGRPTIGAHLAFTAGTRAAVRAFYEAAMANGGRDNGPPGLRPHYQPDYYGAFVLDPDGNNIEAVCHRPE